MQKVWAGGGLWGVWANSVEDYATNKEPKRLWKGDGDGGSSANDSKHGGRESGRGVENDIGPWEESCLAKISEFLGFST